MNKKSYILSSVLIFLLIELIYIASFLSIYLVSNNNYNSRIINQTQTILESLDNGETQEDLINIYYNYKDSRLSFIKADNIMEDSLKVYGDPSFYNVDVIYKEYTSALNSKYSYIVKEISDEEYLRFGLKEDISVVVSFNFLLYGSIAIIILMIAFIIYINIAYKLSLKPLKIQISKLQSIVHKEKNVEYDADLKNLALIVRDSRKELETQFKLTKLGEQKINFILDSFSEALIVIDSNYKIIMFNKKASEIFCVKKEDAYQKSFEILKKAKGLEGNMSMVVQTLRSFIYQEKIEGKVYECIINPINYSWSSINEKPGASLLMIDVTDEYNSSEMKKEFFMNASHELKSPLTSIIGYQEMLKQGVFNSQEEKENAVSKTIKEANRMKKIIYDMLELSSLENEYLRPIEKIYVPLEIDNILSSLDYEILSKKLKIIKNYSNIYLNMNIEDFNRLFKNIIENAIIYNKEEGYISISLDEKNKTITIKDDGIGISEENISRIFERFYRVDKARSRRDGGTGLGLAIAKHICEYYGIKITVLSKINSGTTFILDISKC